MPTQVGTEREKERLTDRERERVYDKTEGTSHGCVYSSGYVRKKKRNS